MSRTAFLWAVLIREICEIRGQFLFGSGYAELREHGDISIGGQQLGNIG